MLGGLKRNYSTGIAVLAKPVASSFRNWALDLLQDLSDQCIVQRHQFDWMENGSNELMARSQLTPVLLTKHCSQHCEFETIA